MKNRTAALLLSAMLAAGVFVIAQNALAVIWPCDWLQEECNFQCQGAWNLDQGCWEYQGSWYCSFVCEHFSIPNHCTWTDPTQGMCWWR